MRLSGSSACWLLLTLLIICSTADAGPMGKRRRRDAESIERGSNWFKSFYSMFSSAASSPAPTSKLGITPLSPQTSKKPINSSPEKSSEAASQDIIGEKKVDPFSVLNSIATDGAKDKAPGSGEAPMPTPSPSNGRPKLVVENYFPELSVDPIPSNLNNQPNQAHQNNIQEGNQINRGPSPTQSYPSMNGGLNQQGTHQLQYQGVQQQQPEISTLPQAQAQRQIMNYQGFLPQNNFQGTQMSQVAFLPTYDYNPHTGAYELTQPEYPFYNDYSIDNVFPDALGYDADQSIDAFMDSSIYEQPNAPTLQQANMKGQDPMKDYAMNSLQGSVPNMAAYDVYSAFGTDSGDSVVEVAGKKGNTKPVLDPVVVDGKLLPPNKPAPSGIPNKKPEIIPEFEGNLGFSLVGPSVRMPKEECLTQSGGIGECLQAHECGLEGGKPDGLCHLGHDAYYHLRTCCVYESFCGYETNKEVTYLKNPEFPQYTKSNADCMFKIDLLPNVCQLRLDFLELEMKPMTDGECDRANSLYVTSSAPDAFIPVKQFCGTVHKEIEDELRTDIPHMYVHVNRDHPSLYGGVDNILPNKAEQDPSVWLTLKVDNFTSRWNIRISQIQCDGANLQAPTGCGQYYNMNTGNITSLNYLDGNYPKNLRLTSCIKRDPTACALELNMKTFQVGDTKGGAGKLGYGLTCKDYFMVNGEKTSICGSNNNVPRRMIFPAHGPESVFFFSDEQFDQTTDVGYHIEYIHHSNCHDLEFYKYPNKK